MDGFVRFFLEVLGEVQGSFSLIPNNYFDVFDVTHVKHKELFIEGKCCSSCILKYYIDWYFL